MRFHTIHLRLSHLTLWATTIFLAWWCLLKTISGSYLPNENDEYWNRRAYQSLLRGIRMSPGQPIKRAKNVILIIGDGMGMSTITAARILKGQLLNHTGEESELSWDKFPRLALAKTYNTDHQVPDSAGTATAMLTGIKTKMSVVGVNDSVEYQKCETLPHAIVPNIADWSQAEGKSAGVVSNSRITHATPSCLYAHAVDRNLESDWDFVSRKIGRPQPIDGVETCKDIARQLVEDEPGNKLKVILGGGWQKFAHHTDMLGDILALTYPKPLAGPNKLTENETPKLSKKGNRVKRMVYGYTKHQADQDFHSWRGNRSDSNLISKWIDLRSRNNDSYAFVATRDQLRDVKAADTDYLFGLFANDHMDYGAQQKRVYDWYLNQPTLPEMTIKALEILEKNPKGYFLLIEGARIDHAHHEGKARRALEETLVLDNVVQAVLDHLSSNKNGKNFSDPVDLDDTLLIVTADHSHVFNLGGYPLRGNPIFGLDREYANKDYELSDVDGLPYTSITYGNGPGGINSRVEKWRQNLTVATLGHADYRAQAAVPLTEETHGGEDVPIYAIGPNSQLFYGVQEQHYIAHVMAYASCVGPYKFAQHCI